MPEQARRLFFTMGGWRTECTHVNCKGGHQGSKQERGKGGRTKRKRREAGQEAFPQKGYWESESIVRKDKDMQDNGNEKGKFRCSAARDDAPKIDSKSRGRKMGKEVLDGRKRTTRLFSVLAKRANIDS